MIIQFNYSIEAVAIKIFVFVLRLTHKEFQATWFYIHFQSVHKSLTGKTRNSKYCKNLVFALLRWKRWSIYKNKMKKVQWKQTRINDDVQEADDLNTHGQDKKYQICVEQ